jgi:hypothetical protein
MEDLKRVDDIQICVDRQFGVEDKSRMLSRLVDNQGLDPWMTFELMEAALRNLVGHLNGVELKENMCRDNATSTTAAPEHLNLVGTEADKYYNFQSIRVDNHTGKAQIRHFNRPDGMFNLALGQDNEMVIFYEGDAHEKDANKSEVKGCKNAHKMYQYMVQAQSKNKRSSGCAIFAAMNDSPTDEVTQFTEDMFKAHMFVGMLIIQHNMYQRKTAKTILEDIMELDTKKKYDFVMGINIKSKAANDAFKKDNFDKRVNDMRTLLNTHTVIDVELQNFGYDRQNELQTWDYTLGCLNITCFAVPRAPLDILNRPQFTRGNLQEPPFIYPLHLSHVTSWSGDKGVAKTQVGHWLLDVWEHNHSNRILDLHFCLHMMKITRVLTAANARAVDNTCVLKDTTGFFYLALPLAYFTIEQFDCLVNARLDYKWSPTRHNVRKMVEALMLKIKGLPTARVKVQMFKTDQKSLLQTICKSTDEHVEDITEEFKCFLKDCCKWDDCYGYAYPAIFFRTLGIFSLQNAIDFACEVKNNQSATYTSLLSTYPIGTQIVIKQCMKKLSTNEAYGYLRREKIVVKTSTVKEQGPSDEDEPIDPIEAIQQTIARVVTHRTTSWHVTNSTESTYQEWFDIQQKQAQKGKRTLQDQLIKQYKKSLTQWRVQNQAFAGSEAQEAERDDNNILRQAWGEQYANGRNTNATIEAPGVNFDSYKYDTQFRVDISADYDDAEVFIFFKPIWPTEMTLEILRNQFIYLGRGKKIYAIFDDKTILCFEYHESVLEKVLARVDPTRWPDSQPPERNGRKVTFAGSTTKVASLNTPPLPDTNDIYL